MNTHICPACGYPTLSPSLCAFCCPGEVRFGNPTFGQMSATSTFNRGSVLLGVRNSDASSVAQDRVWTGPVAS